MLPEQLRSWRRNTRSVEKQTHAMSQREAARLLGVSRSYYRKLENPDNLDPLPNWVPLACSAITFGMRHFMLYDQHDVPR